MVLTPCVGANTSARSYFDMMIIIGRATSHDFLLQDAPGVPRPHRCLDWRFVVISTPCRANHGFGKRLSPRPTIRGRRNAPCFVPCKWTAAQQPGLLQLQKRKEYSRKNTYGVPRESRLQAQPAGGVAISLDAIVKNAFSWGFWCPVWLETAIIRFSSSAPVQLT